MQYTHLSFSIGQHVEIQFEMHGVYILLVVKNDPHINWRFWRKQIRCSCSGVQSAEKKERKKLDDLDENNVH